jgi:serine/threonine protein kinase
VCENDFSNRSSNDDGALLMRELALSKTRLDGRYDVLQLLGRGSYAEVFLAKDNFAAADSPASHVVIKALNVFLQEEPDADLERTLIENFENEAVALDRVRHKNVVARYNHGTAKDLRGTIFHYLVLEYLGGGDLMQLCKQQPLTLEKTLFYLEQVCAGLAHAHAEGVIHRDIKPQNLLLTADRKIVKIADFGVARFGNIDSPITRVGTNIYAAPEHSPLNAAIGNEFRLTPAADVYSLAKTVYALLAGESPRRFSNQPLTEFPLRLLENAWANQVLRVLLQATANEPEKRIQTVGEFWRQICAAASEFDEGICIAASSAAFSSTIAAPSAAPAFTSLPNVQLAPDNAASRLPERPKLVVELANSTPTEKIFAPPADKPLEPIKNGSASMPSSKTAEILSNLQKTKPPRQSSRFAAFLRRLTLRLAVVLILLGVFAGVVAGTYNYLQTRGYFDLSSYIAPTKKGVVVAGGANLRSSPEMNDNNIVGFVTKDSEVKIVGEDGSWYKVEVLKQGQPDNPAITRETRGYIGKKLVNVQ